MTIISFFKCSTLDLSEEEHVFQLPFSWWIITDIQNQIFFFFSPNFYSFHRRHSLRDQPGPELLTSDHHPAGAGGRVAVPSAGWVSDSQLPRGPTALLPHRPSHLMPRAASICRGTIRDGNRFWTGQESFSLPFKRRSERENAGDLMCSTSGHMVTWWGFPTPLPAMVGLPGQSLHLCWQDEIQLWERQKATAESELCFVVVFYKNERCGCFWRLYVYVDFDSMSQFEHVCLSQVFKGRSSRCCLKG